MVLAAWQNSWLLLNSEKYDVFFISWTLQVTAEQQTSESAGKETKTTLCCETQSVGGVGQTSGMPVHNGVDRQRLAVTHLLPETLQGLVPQDNCLLQPVLLLAGLRGL